MPYDLPAAPGRHRAGWTLPRQRVSRRSAGARRLGTAALAVGATALAALLRRRLGGRRPADGGLRPEHAGPARQLAGGAAILAFSVLADSAVEHYRGGFRNPAMYLPPAIAASSLANALGMTVAPAAHAGTRTLTCALSLGTGIAGGAFHCYNIVKREGGLSLANLFYAAPLGAPFAIAAAGLAGLAAAHLAGARRREQSHPRLGAAVALGSAAVMAGTVGEAALLHFRGAYHDPFMFVPVILPPAAATALAAAAWRPKLRPLARHMLRLTAAAGIAGFGFHLFGLQRNMGGFANWTQNLLQGPPLPAPPAFTGVALAGLAGLRLLEAS